MAQFPLFLSANIVYLTSLWRTAELHKTGGKNSDTSLQCKSLFGFANAGEHECQLNWAQDTLLALVFCFTVSSTSTVCHKMPFSRFFCILMDLYKRRFAAIKRCIASSTGRVQALKTEHEKDSSSASLPGAIRKKQHQVCFARLPLLELSKLPELLHY